MLRLQRRRVARSRTLLAWTTVLFAASQLVLATFLTHAHPELRDPEYGSLAQSLHARLAEAPGRPLVLLLGSSRMANMFRPAAMPAADPGGGPLFFNFATIGGGPMRQLQMLVRLLDRGVRPAWVVAELWPPYLMQGDTSPESRVILAEQPFILERDLQWSDWPLLWHHFANPWPAFRKLLEGECLPASVYGCRLLAHFGPFHGSPPEPSPFDFGDPHWRAEGSGWLPAPVLRPEPQYYRRIVAAHAARTRQFLADFAITAIADRAVHDLLRTCARHNIRVALVLAPEQGDHRACYPADMEHQVAAYLGCISRHHHVSVIDVRDWVSDDDYIDMTHVLPRAAGPFTERFGREVLLPLVAGRPLDPALLYLPPNDSELSSPARAAELH
jgi:hypothetical protein